MNSAGRFLPFADRVHYFASAIGAIAAGKNVRQVSLPGFEAARDRSVAIQIEIGENVTQPFILFLLADSFEHHVERHFGFRALNKFQGAT